MLRAGFIAFGATAELGKVLLGASEARREESRNAIGQLVMADLVKGLIGRIAEVGP